MSIQRVNIGARAVGNGLPVFIIAEVSANHRGSLDVALKAIEHAASAGADAVKFQHLRAQTIAADVPANFTWKGQKDFTTYAEFYKKSELPYEWTEALKAHAEKCGIIFLSTPFDHEAVNVLEKSGVLAYKVASYEMTDDILLRKIARTGKPVILSTGMAYLEEVEHAVAVIKKEGNESMVLLHCVSLYPPESRDLNLRAIMTMQKKFDLPVGFSDHTDPSSNAATLGAVALGACVIERHITDSPDGGSRDDKNSMTAEQFKNMVSEIRNLEAALSGSGVKAPVSDKARPMDEMSERKVRRSLYAARDIKAGEILTEEMMITLRPCTSIEPKDAHTVLGKKARVNIKARGPITLNNFTS